MFRARSDYQLGILYERTGQPKQALEATRRFLDAWAKADPDQPELKDARALWTQAHQQPPLSLRIDLALASVYKPSPDMPLFHELAATAFGGLEGKRLGTDAYALLLARAKAQDDMPAGRRAASAAVADLLARAWKRRVPR